MDITTWQADHPSDKILDPIDFEDIIIMLCCNIPKQRHNKEAVLKCYREMLENRLQDAEFILSENIDYILKEAKRQY